MTGGDIGSVFGPLDINVGAYIGAQLGAGGVQAGINGVKDVLKKL